jgi:hypothetical protein
VSEPYPLRPQQLDRDSRIHVAHLFTDDDLWFPYRMTLCGKEMEERRLTPDLKSQPICLTCRKAAAASTAA